LKDLMAASSTPIVLAILAEGDSYGYAILKRVRELSGGRLEWTDGMLYPVLHRLERLGHEFPERLYGGGVVLEFRSDGDVAQFKQELEKFVQAFSSWAPKADVEGEVEHAVQ
jgi:hypothetical protein